MATAPQPRESDGPPFSAAQAAFYGQVLDLLAGAAIPHLIGGAYALRLHTGLHRDTKDLDVFVRQADLPAALAACAAAGHHTELTFPHWLAKVHDPAGHFVDLIHGSGNGLCPVDDSWFTRAVAGELLGRPVRACAAEDMIWSKAFIMERERFDGADILHLLRGRAETLDWPYLQARFAAHAAVLLAHLLLFGYVYPGERHRVPAPVLDQLWTRAREPAAVAPDSQPLCRGTLLSRAQYLVDIGRWGYRDARRQPAGALTADDIRRWTDPIRPEDRPR